jgi:cyanophycinase
MNLTEAVGKLIIIGGAEDKEKDCRILKEFIAMSGNGESHIVVMTVATNSPEEAGKEYRNVFKRLGAKNVETVDVASRSDAANPKLLEKLQKATGVFFTGGDQLHITSLIGGTEMQATLRQMYKDKVLIAGTSAGAAMMGNSMIVSGDSDEAPKQGAVEMAPGMDFILGSIIDTHFSQRGRHGRLLTAIAHYPQELGIGIDEDTALVVKGSKLSVIGSGTVTVFDGSAMTYTNLPYVKEKENLSLVDVRVHVLSEGMKFNLPERQPIIPEREKMKR